MVAEHGAHKHDSPVTLRGESGRERLDQLLRCGQADLDSTRPVIILAGVALAEYQVVEQSIAADRRFGSAQGCVAIQQIRDPVLHVRDLPVALRRVASPDDRYLRSSRREDAHHFPAESARTADDQSM